jgi:tRNA-dihydrouridine synthase
MDWKGERVGIVEMRRHYTNYFKNVPSFKEYKQRLVTTDAPEELFKILIEIEEVFGNHQFA